MATTQYGNTQTYRGVTYYPTAQGTYTTSPAPAPSAPSAPSAPVSSGGGVSAVSPASSGSTYQAQVNLTPLPGSGNAPYSGSAATIPGGPGVAAANLTKPIVKSAFKDTAAYRALPQAAKDFVDLAYNLIEIGGEAEASLFANAIAQAQAVADPYYKTQLALAKAEVMASIAEKNNDYETKAEIIKRTRDELMADVSGNKEFLTLEQQAEIAREVVKYDEDLLSIADEAADKGLTFATGARSRALAEERRVTQYGDVVQSSQRRHNFQIKELSLKAARGDIDAQKKLASLGSEKSFALKQIGRAAEEVLGSANAPVIEGYDPVGGVIGKTEEAKRKSILSDVSGFMTLQKGFI